MNETVTQWAYKSIYITLRTKKGRGALWKKIEREWSQGGKKEKRFFLLSFCYPFTLKVAFMLILRSFTSTPVQSSSCCAVYDTIIEGRGKCVKNEWVRSASTHHTHFYSHLTTIFYAAMNEATDFSLLVELQTSFFKLKKKVWIL